LLVVEDESSLLTSLCRGLREEGYDAIGARTAHDARSVMRAQAVDAVVLDLVLPDNDGFGLLSNFRATGFTGPILVVTARDTTQDRIEGLDTGADDYLIKPFSFDELLARLRALLRRTAPAGRSVRIEDLELNLETRLAQRDGQILELTPRQFQLLLYLARQQGQAVSRDAIAADVWREATASWTNVIEVQISRLRRKIDRPGLEPLLHTVRGRGYALGRRC